MKKIKVIMTRKTDVKIGLTQRANIANNAKADIFVSIHCNAFDGMAKGLETFHHPNSVKGKELASKVQESILNAGLYTINRGVKNARFTVLTKTNMPAILVELAFVDNKEDSEFLKNKKKEFAGAIARGIRDYAKLHKVDTVVIDAGHGATDPGAVGKFLEKNINLEVALLLEKELTKEDKPIEEKPSQSRRSRYFEVAGLQVIETDPANIYIAGMGDKTLRQLGTYGINGTFFNTKNPKPLNSCWMIAVNNGHPLSGNAQFNGWNQPARGTMFFDGQKIQVKRVKSINELPKNIVWAIGGGSLVPEYVPLIENWDSTVTYTTNRTGIAYRENKVFLIVAKNMSMMEFRNKIINHLKAESAIFLDGGGSTQMNYVGNKGISSTRGLNNLIGIRSV